ncbi:undecaprenyl/decaprenyl-phosphate alpha-N-acetylglucosaminyl 1-phosphate transferase [Gammaproteobacteria bacterium]|nr:undecaprenyl/decaprenyl-phosphate alpha-N-acetylglucosaminyl 1-phosphate transferase [Gammaproteobacteria bacterium]
MGLNIIISYLIISIMASLAINSILRNFAKQKNILVDIPDRSRKFHKRATPLTGGIGILLAVAISSEIYLNLNNLKGYMPEFSQRLYLASIPLLLLFLIDDFKPLKPILRLFIQIILSLYVIYSTDIYLTSFGNLFGFGEINLGIFGIPITVFCVVGVMNAFNMIDGINGLCAGSAMMALLFTGFYSGLMYDSMLMILIGSVIGFLIFNLRFFGEKRGVFLGDSGSNLMGFWVAWIAIYSSQNTFYQVEPITMLWFVSIPFLDCIGLIFSRITQGINITSPGRDHIHHKLMLRYSSDGSLGIILLISFFAGFLGIFLDNNYSQSISTYLFMIYSAIYYLFAYRYKSFREVLVKNV